MPRRRSIETEVLFPPPEPLPLVVRNPKAPKEPVWTENKARLIERYLYGFVLVTKHGTYIDGFAGPQRPNKPDAWSARLVLASEPQWLRHFHLFDRDRSKIRHLERLRDEHEDRDIRIYRGDFNDRVQEILRPEVIGPREATFCLIDQWTLQCRWETLEAIAAYKPGMKIELFYFLANFWLARTLRSLSTAKGRRAARAWWGRDDWLDLADMHSPDRAQLVAQRFRAELGYKSAFAWPIYGRKDGGAIMYYMVHATDHPRGAALMRDAYEGAVAPKPPLEQLALKVGLPPP